MPKVLFKVQGGHDLGMGHVFRSLCLADAMRECGMAVAGFLCNDDPICLALIQARGHRELPRSDGEVASSILSALEHKAPRPRVLVLDQPDPEPDLLADLRRDDTRLRLVALDYTDPAEKNLDLAVNLRHHRPSPLAPCLEGLEYALIRPAFDPWIARERMIRPRIENVLVCFGGSDSRGNTAEILRSLADLATEDIRFHVIIGPHDANKDNLDRPFGDLPVTVHLHESPGNLEELMFSCDLGIIGAGTMMLEMAAVGTPSLVLPQNEREEEFGRLLAIGGAVRMPWGTTVPSGGQLRKAILELSDALPERQRMSGAGKALVDGKGRRRIAHAIQRLT